MPMTYNPLDSLPLAVCYLLLPLILLGATELGFRAGRAGIVPGVQDSGSHSGAAMGAAMGLLAFLLAFTFNMSSSRFDDRKGWLMKDVMALDSMWKHSAFLPDDIRPLVRDGIRELVELRVDGVNKFNLAGEEARQRSNQILKDIRQSVTPVLRQSSQRLVTGFSATMDNMDDVQLMRRHAGLHNRIPLTIWFSLILVALIAMAIMGYHSGISGRRSKSVNLAVVLIFGLVFALITDLDRPGNRQSLFVIDSYAMDELLKDIRAESP